MGKLLRVDLTRRRVSEETVSSEMYRRFLGGRGVGVALLYDAVKPRVDPLSEDNVLMFVATPLNGTGAPSFVKYTVETKSPLTGTVLMTLAGGHFAAELRRAGLDAIVVEGRAEAPSYLWVTDGATQIRDATHLWGMTTMVAQSYLKEETDPHARAACIGPAGENLVRYADVQSDRHACGRGGAGAVMGSKKLKAIAVKGSQEAPVADPARFREVVKRLLKAYSESDGLKALSKYSTPKVLPLTHERGILPTRNFTAGFFEPALTTINPHYHQKLVTKKTTCYRCPVACINLTVVKKGDYAGAVTEGPDYETLWSFGPQCDNDNLESIVKADELCDDLGLDTISTGNAIGFAMECFQKGILTERETHGLRLEFGNHEAMVEAVRKIAFREAIGDQMAEGVARWSETLGPEAERYAMHVKGLELPAYDPRGAKGMALEYATSPRGGCHERGLLSQETFGVKPHVDRLSYEGKPELLRKVQIRTAVLDSLGACIFPMQNATIPMEELTDLYAAVTGFSVSTDELWLAGERILTLERLFNVREGFNRRADILPSRLLEEPLPDGASKGEVVSLSPLLDRYYEVMGWNENGIPTPEKLAQLDLPQNWQAG